MGVETGKILGIMGAGGLAREVLEIAKNINKTDQKWSGYIFIDKIDSRELINGHTVYDYKAAKNEFGNRLEISMGIGEPSLREKLFREVKEDGLATPTLIHPGAYVSDDAVIGKGVVIQYGSFISCNVHIEDYVLVQAQCNIGHDNHLEEGSIISGFGNTGGDVHIGRYTYVGLSTAIKQGISVGAYSIIGMGSMVVRDIPDEVIAMGNPARPMKNNEERRVFLH